MDTEPQIDPSSPVLEPSGSGLTLPSEGPLDDAALGVPAPPGSGLTVPSEGSLGTTSALGVSTPTAILPKAPETPRTNTSVGKTSPIAKAIRSELRTLVDVEVLELQVLSAVIQVARSGRDLVAVRNPIMRFDAKAQGLEAGSDPCAMTGPVGGFICGPEDMDEDYDHWDGPAIRGANERRKKDIRDALQHSPLAIAVKAELLELADTDPFGPSELVQIEQLATHAQHVLSAALGLPTNAGPQNRGNRRIMGGNISYGGSYGMNPMPMSSSPETFGAKMSREMIAATAKKEAPDPEKLVLAIASARQNGLDDVAAKLEEQLGIQPSPPSQSAGAGEGA